MISILYNISCSMEKLGKPFHRSALLCGVALLLIAASTSTRPTEAGVMPEVGFAAFTIVTCLQDTPLVSPKVTGVDPVPETPIPAVLEECASDGNSSCGGCISAILTSINAPAGGVTVTHQTTQTKPRRKGGTLHHFTITCDVALKL